MAMGADLGRAYGPAVPSQPKPKPPERNDYDIEVLLLVGEPFKSVATSHTKESVIRALDNLAAGFTKEVGGVLTKITKYNILYITATKKEKNVTDAVPESSQSQSTAADGVLSAHPTGL